MSSFIIYPYLLWHVQCKSPNYGLKSVAKWNFWTEFDSLWMRCISCVLVCLPFADYTAFCHTMSVGHYTETPSARTDTHRADWHWVCDVRSWYQPCLSALSLQSITPGVNFLLQSSETCYCPLKETMMKTPDIHLHKWDTQAAVNSISRSLFQTPE